MTQITIEIPDELMSLLEQKSSSMQEIVIKAFGDFLKRIYPNAPLPPNPGGF